MNDRQREEIRGISNPTQLILLLMFVTAFAVAPVAEAQLSAPAFSKIFVPSTIGPGSLSTLTFTITNENGVPITDMGFTDVLPVGVSIASPSNASTSCANAVLTAPDGGGTVTFSNGDLGAFATCGVAVDVTSSTAGLYQNSSSSLTSNEAPSSEPASADLNVVTNLPGFSKAFSPSSVPLGGRSILTFTIDNTANASAVLNLDFTDNLPTGMEIADPPVASTTCGTATIPPTLTAAAGTSLIVLDANGTAAFPAVAAGATCTVTIDVATTGIGALHNVSGDLLADFVASGKASATLDVTVTELSIAKDFTDDPVPPGGTVTLDFTIDNVDRNFSATGVTFTDDLSTVLAGLTFSSLVSSTCGGSVTGVGGTSIGLTGGTLAPEASCTISTSLTVPGGATPGAYTNTTDTVSGTIDSSPVVGNAASDLLFVESTPVLTKEFIGDPVNPGDTVVLRFTILNTSPTSAASDIEFFDEFFVGLPTAPSIPAPGFCGSGSVATFTPLFNPPPPSSTVPARLSVTGANLAASASCTFDITLDVAPDVPPGIYPNLTSSVTATIDAATKTGKPASDELEVIAAPQLTKAFTDDPVAPGGTVTLEFTLTNSPNASGDATGITFTDDLATVLTGLTANLPPNPVEPCGVGSTLNGAAGDTLLTLQGGTLAPGTSCTFSVTLNLPPDAAPGSYTNTTSGVSATVGGLATTSAPASDDLRVDGLTFTKQFIGDPVVPGETVTLRFTLENISPTDDASSISFTDDLRLVLPGTPDLSVVAPLPTTPCGPSSTLTEGPTGFLTLAGGELAQGSPPCTINVTLQVPVGAPNGSHINTTSILSAIIGGSGTSLDPATDELVIDPNQLQLTKEFTNDPVAPGDTVNLRFTIDNLDVGQAASAVAFTDDLSNALAGLVATGLPFAACGGTVAAIPDASTIDFSGGILGPGGQCQFDVSVSVPGAAAAGTYGNTTGTVTGSIGGLAVSGDPASDDLEVLNLLSFSKSFDGPTTANGTAVLSFTITNPGGSAAANIGFSDDLDSVISGLVATNLPLSDVCGTGSQLSGTSFIIMTGGNLPPMGGTCSFSVDVLVPGTATAGTFPNTTSDLLQAGLTVSPPATADLVIEPPPTFAKAFAPVGIAFGGVSTLTFTIDNTASSFAATGLDFSDNLPAGIVVATPANASTTCTGGTLTAVAGSGVLSYTGGSVAAGATCTVQADVMGAASGAFVNTTGDLTSSSGNSGPASATLNVSGAAPAISKAFGSSTIVQGGTTTLSFTITNTDLLASATGITFTDDLDAALPGMVATDTPLTNPCGSGSQLTGTSLLTLTGGTLAPGASCNFTVTVSIPDTASPGLFTNTSSAVSATVGGTPVAGDPADAAQDSVTVLAAAAAAIPTLSQWGLLLLVLLMSTAGVLILRRY